MRSFQVLLLWIREDLEEMAKKEYSALPEALGLDIPYQIV